MKTVRLLAGALLVMFACQAVSAHPHHKKHKKHPKTHQKSKM